MSTPQIEGFLARVQRRLTLRSIVRAAVTVLLAASIAMLVVALAYVVRGYAVDRRWYAVVAAMSGAAMLAMWLLRRVSSETAARFADRYYGLQDGLVSWLHFTRQNRVDGFYALQAAQTQVRIGDLDPQRIDWRPSRTMTLLAVVLAISAIGLAWKKPSAAVEQRLAQEANMWAETERINEELEKLADELDRDLEDPQERELLEPEKLKQLIEQLKSTHDQKEALRQYARVERQLNEARAKLQQRRDEHLLAEAARELEKHRETKPLAEKLTQKKYDQAAQELQDAAPNAKKKLSEQQRELAKLRSASQRLATAARTSAASSSNGGAGDSSGSGADANHSSDGELAQAIHELDDALKEWDEALSEAARQEEATGQCDSEAQGQCQSCQKKAGEKLSQLANFLRRMKIKCDCQSKLALLCKACSQCQGGLCQSPNAGGKKAGWGSNTARRDEQNELVDSGQTEQLKGIKREGPSQKTVEAADDGTGTASRTAEAKVRTYERQYESFVSREDVPEEVKEGVKNYFQAIHQVQEAP